MCQGCEDWQEYVNAIDQFIAKTMDLTPFSDEDIAILNGQKTGPA